MYLAMALILGVLWVLGITSGYTFGGAVYALLAGAVIMTVLGLRQWWRRPA
jgi:hypothetical protein